VKKFFVGFLIILINGFVLSQNVTHVESRQVENKIEITYILDKKADISIQMSENGGVSYKDIVNVIGDVGKNISAGTKKIVWDVLTERDKLQGENIVFKVMAKSVGENIVCTLNDIDFEMVFVEGGTFTMGCTPEQSKCNKDEKPAHFVILSNYYIGKYEVTQAQWRAVMGNNPSYFNGDNLPVENVSWNDAQEFVHKLNNQTGKNYRLPTEAEWEYACRGGKFSASYKYSGSNTISDVAWYYENSDRKTHPVGYKQANELGIYDMSGNVWEWCSDWYGSYNSNLQTNPQGASTGSQRVLRGGSWNNHAQNCRVSYRHYSSPDSRGSGSGFRLTIAQD